MGNGFLTLCALTIVVLISVVFFSKKRIKNTETSIFKYMLILNIIESTLTNLIVIMALTINNTQILILLNRLDVIAIISWCSLMFYYIYNVSRKNENKLIKNLILIINTIVYILALYLDVTIINSNGVMDSSGPLTTLGLIGAIVYIIFMIVTVILKNNKKNRTKYVPLYFLIILIIFVAVLRAVIPEVNFISLLISFVNLIMIFTIENPDIKMVNELIENKKIIERASEEKATFLFKMSQGLKEPSNNINRQVDIYKENKLTKKDTNTVIDIIDKNNQKINYLINDVIGISSFDTSNIKKVESSYNIYSLLKNIDKRGRTYLKKDIDYNFSYVSNIPKELYGDSIKIKQVLMSILINAIQNTEKGFVHVDINAITKYDICRLVIQIEDSGKGMSLKSINDILNQELDLDDKDYLGIDKLNVDLRLSYKIIKSLGGTMYIKSEENRGTEVIITLDQYIVNDKYFSFNEKIESYNNTKKILIINDEDQEINKIKKKLEYLEYDVSISMYGMDAIDKIKNKEKFDIILIDDEMPLMNGISILQELNKLNNKSKKIVLLEEDKLFISAHYLEDGFDDYIDKTHLLDEIDKKC